MVPGLFELYFANHKRAKEEEEDIMMVFVEEYEKNYDQGYIAKGMKSTYQIMRGYLTKMKHKYINFLHLTHEKKRRVIYGCAFVWWLSLT